MDEDYKSLLIMNKTSEADITFYLYLEWDIICWLSYSSKIIKPGKKHYHRSKSGFKYKIVARFNLENKRKTKTVVEVEKWKEDKVIIVSDSLDITEGKLDDFPQEKQICLRNLNKEKDVSSYNGGRNLYEILKLDIRKVRKMSEQEQNETIRKAFHKEIRRWHPDHHHGDEEIAREVIMAYDVLGHPETRAAYNNKADYDRGWLSVSRFKAIFWADYHTDEQKKAFKRRLKMMLLSAGLVIGGLAGVIGTAGLAAPALVVVGAVLGSGVTGAGLQSLPETTKREAVVDGCNINKWLGKAAVGFVAGAATGGAAVGISAAVTGIGSAALESAAVSAGKYIAVGASTGATGGVVQALASNAGRKFVDGQDVTLKQVARHAFCGAAIGALAGVVGGSVTNAVTASQASAAAANIQGEIGEQVAILSGAKRLANTFTRNLTRALTENGTESVGRSAAMFLEERLDDSLENRSPTEHLAEGAQNLAFTAVKDVTTNSASAAASHAFNEFKVTNRMKKESKASSSTGITEGNKSSASDEIAIMDGDKKDGPNRARIRRVLDEEANEHLVKWDECRGKGTYQATFTGDIKKSPQLEGVLPTMFETEDDGDGFEDGHVKYICDGWYWSKMVVTYNMNNKECTEEVSGSGKSIDIPARARQVKVRFQVMRPVWCDVLKYDRFGHRWCKPYEAHVFQFEFPPIRTFSISGSLHYEAVMKVTNEYYDETEDM